MEKHQFKVIYLSDEDVYRIIDLTDTSLVGRTEMFDDFFDDEREQRKQYYKDIKGKQREGAKVAGYGVFIFVDEDNSPERPSDEDYVRRVLNQMASFFKEEVISKQPNKFKDYIVSNNTAPKPSVAERIIESFKSCFNSKEGFLLLIPLISFLIIIAISSFLGDNPRVRGSNVVKNNTAIGDVPIVKDSVPPWMIDSLVALQFLGVKLNENITTQLEGIPFEKTERVVITTRLVDEYRIKKYLTIEKKRYPVDVLILTLDDTVSVIQGTIKEDIYYPLCKLYTTKYGKPSAVEGYIESGSYRWWRFVNNQDIKITWNAPENEFGKNIYKNIEIR